MRILFVLPGLHRFNRGAEIAFISIASELANAGETVTLLGSGPPREQAPYRFLRAASMRRENFERFPSLPCLRDECAYEELTFVPGLLRRYRPINYDVTLTCSYPFCNWLLRRPAAGRVRPPHVFVTQNGDWPAYSNESEYRFFDCEGLVCTNPDYFRRNQGRWRCELIPNGVDCELYTPGSSHRDDFGLPPDRLVVLMVSALISSKRVSDGIEAVSHVPDAHLVVAGDGPLRRTIEMQAARLLPNRFTRLSIAPAQMPLLYRSADIFLHMSKGEPSSLAFLEAMSCGLPIVAHDAPQLRWIAGDDEYLLDTDNPIDVAEKIGQARNATETQRLKRLAKVKDFSWKSIAAKYGEFLKRIAA